MPSWEAPRAKRRSRAAAIAAPSAPACQNPVNNATRALPTTGHAAQFLPFLAPLQQSDIRVTVRLLRFSGGAL
eukprot:2604996-Pyramimonas_sp.AAC.1